MNAIERAARAVSEYMMCGHCDGSCEDCTGEARVVFESIDVDELAQEIRRVDGNHDMGAGALAEAIYDYLTGDESDE